MSSKWKKVINCSIVAVVLVAVVLVFYFVILYTPNINFNVKFISNRALGTIDSRISNASNGAPTNLFNYDYTNTEPETQTWECKNVLFKGDKETITLDMVVSNMAHFKTLVTFSFKSPHKNAKVITLLNDVECDISSLVFEPYSENKVSIVIGKQNYNNPIRAKLNLTIELTPQ